MRAETRLGGGRARVWGLGYLIKYTPVGLGYTLRHAWGVWGAGHASENACGWGTRLEG